MTIKKARTLSRVKVDKTRNKYVEALVPPSDTVIGNIQVLNYVIQRIDLGKQTHDSASGDVISTLEALVERYDEDKI